MPPINFMLFVGEEELRQLREITDIDRAVRNDQSLLALFSNRGDMAWSALSFLHLRNDARLNVRLSNRFDPSSINVAPTQELLHLRPRLDVFVVGVQADFKRRPWAHHHIVQNQTQANARCSFIPHWPQPGLIPRNDKRPGLAVAAYLGQQSHNLAWPPERWQQLLSHVQMTFASPGPAHWHDMRGYDIIIAVRSFDTQRYDNKPPSKLLNAWHAGVPFIGGADSAYDQVGRPGKTHFRVTSPEAMIEAIKLLRSPAVYKGMIDSGRAAAADFTVAAITDCWIALLTGPIADRWVRWSRAPQQEAARAAALVATDSLQLSGKRIVRSCLKFAKRRL